MSFGCSHCLTFSLFSLEKSRHVRKENLFAATVSSTACEKEPHLKAVPIQKAVGRNLRGKDPALLWHFLGHKFTHQLRRFLIKPQNLYFEILLSIPELFFKKFKCIHFWRKDNGTNPEIEENYLGFSAAQDTVLNERDEVSWVASPGNRP